MTNLEMTQGVQTRLKNRLTSDDRLILDFDDGVGPYSKVGVCSLEVSFRFLIVNKDAVDPVYDETLDSPVGQVHIKGYADSYLNEAPKLALSHFGLIQLSSAVGVLDTNVAIIDHPEALIETK
ncbi:iron-sulfur cluster biosynthesis family protein [Secundilactobacillus paracollinoides]|uniref:Core domain-containing protein n=1 Tax=Secundilactobacillus paracollinoides TaxID=240427 RepID=A0A1B2IXW0_9LACO|nr:iron-sulfur cluster biosynthesis family protein [Secundilactobacillus paracollinoides]ANZ61016.1 hypothetical protein AYR61_06440 [Secundilactobacillus paracollinoides]ANZ66873.1 hypothetical protein AYR63_06800 [Secundilactobacillus paracollinoides]